jgi:hypothetical protein
MSAVIIPIGGKSAVDAAWDAYLTLWDAERADPALQGDRAHVERRVAAHVRFCELYAADCRRDNVVPFAGASK